MLLNAFIHPTPVGKVPIHHQVISNESKSQNSPLTATLSPLSIHESAIPNRLINSRHDTGLVRAIC